MKLSELKKICAKSLELSYTLHTLEIKHEDSSEAEKEKLKKEILTKEEELKICKEIIDKYSFVFVTSVKNLKEKLQGLLKGRLGLKVEVKRLNLNKNSNSQINSNGDNLEKNNYSLVVNINAVEYSILQFETEQGLHSCENTIVNLFNEGMVYSYNFKTKFESVEKDAFNTDELAWRIAEQNLQYLNNNTNKTKRCKMCDCSKDFNCDDISSQFLL